MGQSACHLLRGAMWRFASRGFGNGRPTGQWHITGTLALGCNLITNVWLPSFCLKALDPAS